MSTRQAQSLNGSVRPQPPPRVPPPLEIDVPRYSLETIVLVLLLLWLLGAFVAPFGGDLIHLLLVVVLVVVVIRVLDGRRVR